MTVVHATAERDGRHDGWALTYRFDPTVIAAIKTSVPGMYRHWRQATRTWWVRDDFLDELTAELAMRGHRIRIEEAS